MYSQSEISVLNTTFGKMQYYLSNHNKILVSVSGGSDSDIIVHILCTRFKNLLSKITFAFIDTGLEWDATRKHLTQLEEKYHIKIEHLCGKPIPLCVKEYGVPLISKYHSEFIDAYCRNIRWAMKKYAEGIDTYSRYGLNRRIINMTDACKERGIKVSNKCCKYAKKKPIQDFMKSNQIDLNITGERHDEGGVRATAYHDCFVNKERKPDKYMPIFYWSNSLKRKFKEEEGITYSDCYEIYGMQRTGCCGCPYNSKANEEIKTMQKYEPKLAQAAMNVFRVAYDLMNEFPAGKRGVKNV